MKLVKMLTVTALMFSSMAFAEYTNIPADQLESYKTAVEVASRGDQIKCRDTDGNIPQFNLLNYTLETDLPKVNFGFVDLSGNQPIIKLVHQEFENPSIGHLRTVFTIVSSTDLKKISSMKVDMQRWSNVNTGDLRVPQISQQYVSRGAFYCQASGK